MRAPSFTPPSPVIRAEDLGHLGQATTYLAHARKLAEEAKSLAASEQQRALEAGYADGFRRGVREALAQLGPAVAEARARLAGSEADLAAIVIGAVEQIMGRFDSGELARRLVAKAIADARGQTGIALRVAAEDLAVVEAEVAALRAEGKAEGLGEVRTDPLLKPGEMVLATPRGHVHIGLRQQIGRLQAGLGLPEGV